MALGGSRGPAGAWCRASAWTGNGGRWPRATETAVLWLRRAPRWPVNMQTPRTCDNWPLVAVLVGARAVCVREGLVCVLGLRYPPLPGPLSWLNRPLVCPVLLCLEWCVLLRLCRVLRAKMMGL